MKRVGIAVIFPALFAVAAVFAQSTVAGPTPGQLTPPDLALPTLTRAQMLEDFDALVKIVRDVMPTVAANKAVYGFDVFEGLARYRARIPSVRSTAEFVLLLDAAINSCKASHFNADSTTVAAFKSQEWLRGYAEGFVTEAALEKNEKYMVVLKQARQRTPLNIPLFYLDGSYYVRHDFTFAGKAYARGSRVVSCNNRQPAQIVADNADTIAMLPWDFAHRQFYSTSFFSYPGVAQDGRLTFVFQPAEGAPITASFPADAKVAFEAPARTTDRQVAYLEKSAVVYIRVPSMNPADTPFYTARIAEEGKGRKVNAAVIDIRGNGGGSDSVWRQILEALVASDVKFRETMAIRNTELARRYVARTGSDFAEHAAVRRIPFLGNEEFAVVDNDFALTPASDSLRVPVVYVITNSVFSAAGSLTTVARLAAPIVSVGLRNPYILGRGINPFHFSLPQSGFTFQIEPVVDLTGASKAEDVFHTAVEVEIKPTLGEMLAFHNEKQENLEDFLTNHDPFFRRVLTLLSARQTAR